MKMNHRAPNPADCGRVMSFYSNPSACWFDDYLKVGAAGA